MSSARWWAVAIGSIIFLGGRIVDHEYFACGTSDSPTSDYQSIKHTVSGDLIEHTGLDHYDHGDRVDLGLTICLGHAMCRVGMSYWDCETCLYVASNYRIRDCKFSKEYRVKLKDCYVRLEDHELDDSSDVIMGT